ncbi:WGxxGxxG-CTERM domain-containing protein [Microcoleus vaginatus GB1-A2]|uniref:WGxxGxxG family protein n=1 Tax=Microcoleus vaginatus TaxID=119532 RepID=UPI001689AF75|nr:WGxxGxxG-CTERM domain-containing protein [Microcoleus sp. FACHB-61]
MKRSDLSKAIGAGIIAAGLAIAPAHLPASAQTDTTGGTNNTTTTTTTPGSDVATAETDRDFDWGWLGLLGLSGLLGLIPRKREENVRYTTTTGDRDPAVRTDYR